MSGIAAAALSALQTNSTALRVVSNNVANLNTEGYARRVVNEKTVSVAGALGGVGIGDIERVVDRFLNAETLSANSGASRYDTQSDVFNQLNGLLGQPGDSSSLTSRLTALSAAIGQAATDPTASASQVGALNSFRGLAQSISGLATSVARLRDSVDQQVAGGVGDANALIKQIYDLNVQVKTAQLSGGDSSAVLDQRDQALQKLAQLVGVKTSEQPDGRVTVMTEDGIGLVGDSYAKLAYSPGASNGAYGPLAVQNVNASTGEVIGQPQNLEPHLASGKLRGLLDMRDGSLADLGEELGNLAQTAALAYNRVHNANTAFPPPPSLAGRNTGLLASDALNFSGKTTVAVADSGGNLVSRIDIDFGAQTISVDGGAATAFANTVGGLTAALNGALGAKGSASFANGALSIEANGGNGIVVQDDPATPSSRGGSPFAQFFGLNDVFTTGAPAIAATGLSASDASGLAAGGQIALQLKGPNGDIARQATVTVSAGMTVGQVVNALNTAMGGQVSFTLNGDGSIGQTRPSMTANYALNITDDSTARGDTGLSFTQLFGIGDNRLAAQATSFAVSGVIAGAPQRLAFAKAQIAPASAIGQSIVGHGDNSGSLALQAVDSSNQSFAAAGGLGGQAVSLGDYAAAFYQDVAGRSADAQSNRTTQDDRLQEAQSRQSATSGVNLDEELTHMMTYQQAYSAGARMLQVVQQLYDTLLQVQ